MWKKFFGAALALALSTSLALAQTNPGLTQGQKLTPAQWNNLFASKQDTLGYTPLNQAGGSMSGRLVTAAPGASTAGFNLTPGTAPGSPANGDMWVTSTSAFARVNGVTYDLLSPASSGVVVGSTTITGGTNGRVLRNNSGVLGEYTITGSAGSVVMSSSPTIASPTLTGTAVAPTQSAGDNSTKIATTAYVDTAARTKLTADTTFYRRSDGSDTLCNGTVNASSASTPNCAKLTWNSLYSTVAALYDTRGFNITLKSGTTDVPTSGLAMNIAWVGGGTLVIDGGGSGINEASTKAIINNAVQPGPFYVRSFSNAAGISTAAGSCIQNSAPSDMVFDNLTGSGNIIGSCAESDFEALQNSNLYVRGAYTVTGNVTTGSHAWAGYGSLVSMVGATATFSTNRTYSVAFAYALSGGLIEANGWTKAGAGTVSGPRYNTNAGRINTNAGGANFFPGTTAGVGSNGGCYDNTCWQTAINGGSAAGSGVTITSTRNASPSADFIGLIASTVNIGGIAGGGATTVNFGSPGAASATLAYSGSTSGHTNLKASAVASGTLTLPAATDTLVGKATTDTLTNKTINCTSGTNTCSNISTNTNISMGSGPGCGTIPQNATSYFGTNGCWAATEAAAQTPVSAPFTLKNFYAAASVAPASGQTFTITVRKAGADTSPAVTCTITGPATSCNDTTHTASFAAGDLISVKLVASATSGSTSTVNTMSTGVTTSP